MIQEPEMRELFAAEAAEILERLESGLLALERSPDDRAQLDHLFRQAHSLKGSAASLGLSAVESVAHRFEDALDAARQGRQSLDAERADRLYRTLDALRLLVEEAVTGRASGVDMRTVLSQLDAPASHSATAVKIAPDSGPQPERVSQSDIVSEQDTMSDPAPETVASLAREVGHEPVASDFASPTVRVETVRLDRALAETGDLAVTAARIGLRRREARELGDLHEAWMRDLRRRHPELQGDADLLHQLTARVEILIRSLADDQARLGQITEHLRDEIQEMRLVPLSGLFQRFPRVVRDLARQEGKEIQLLLEGQETTADRMFLERLAAPLTHLIRNAVDHAVELPEERRKRGKRREAVLKLSAQRRGGMLEVTLSDDGTGLDFHAIRRKALEQRLRTPEELSNATDGELSALIFVPGFSTRSVVSDLSGRGAGLDAVRTDVESMGGTISVHSVSKEGSTFRMRIPLGLATSQVMVCGCGDRLFAIPLVFVEKSLIFDGSKTFTVEGRLCLEVDRNLVPISALDVVLGLKEDAGPGSVCLVLSDRAERFGFVTQSLHGVMELVVKPFYESPLIQGASILPDGRVCLVLAPNELFRLTRSASSVRTGAWLSTGPKVLLAEDSPTVRMMARKALVGAGYRVTEAKDGAEAWSHIRSRHFDAIVSDIEMPNLNGIELTQKARALAEYREVPIILITSLNSPETRKAGLEAGASAYLEKSTIDQGAFLTILERLL